jgi:hypothetical protein
MIHNTPDNNLVADATAIDPRLQMEKAQGDEDSATDSHIEEQDGGYGWVCVFAQLMITAHTWGVNGVNSTII